MWSNLDSISCVKAFHNRILRQSQLAETVLPILLPSLNCQKLKAHNQSIIFVLHHKLILESWDPIESMICWTEFMFIIPEDRLLCHLKNREKEHYTNHIIPKVKGTTFQWIKLTFIRAILQCFVGYKIIIRYSNFSLF